MLKAIGRLVIVCFEVLCLLIACLLLMLIAAPLYAIARLIVPADDPFWIPVNDGMADARQIIARIYEVWSDES